MREQKPPSRGDLIQVDWVDIYEDVTGDPSAAELAVRTSFGLFWGQSESAGIKTVVTTTTQDEGVTGQSGYCCYPEGVIRKIRVIKRKRSQV